MKNLKVFIVFLFFTLLLFGNAYSQTVCDVTNKPISEGQGYLATTTEVLTSKYYWRYYESSQKRMVEALGMKMDENHLFAYAENINKAGGGTPWLLSEDAAKLLKLNYSRHRELAVRWWKNRETFLPPGNGPADMQKVYQAIRNRNR